MKFFYFFLLIPKIIIYSLNIVEEKDLSFTSPDKPVCLISNYFTHETFLNNIEDPNNKYESSIFFIIGEKYKKTVTLAKEIEEDLEKLKNEIKILGHDFTR